MNFKISAVSFLRALAAVAPAISTDTTRPHLASLRIESTEGGIVLVATDGHRLHAARVKCAEVAADQTTLVAAKDVATIRAALNHAIKQCDKRQRDALIATWEGTTQGNESIALGSSVTRIRAVDAAFPPWRQVINVHDDAKYGFASFAPEYLRDAWACVALFSEGQKAPYGLQCIHGNPNDAKGSLQPLQLQCERTDGDFFAAIVMPQRNDRAPVRDLASRLASAETKPAAVAPKASAPPPPPPPPPRPTMAETIASVTPIGSARTVAPAAANGAPRASRKRSTSRKASATKAAQARPSGPHCSVCYATWHEGSSACVICGQKGTRTCVIPVAL